MKLFTILYIVFNVLQGTSQETQLKWTVLPIENAEEVFNQCSREAPKFRKVISLDSSVYVHAINQLKAQSEKLYEKVKVRIDDYTLQLVAYKHKRKEYIYINANNKDPFLDQKMKWKEQAIIWCDGNKSSCGLVYDVQQNCFIDFVTNGPVVSRFEKL